jgi:hypothetical protein
MTSALTDDFRGLSETLQITSAVSLSRQIVKVIHVLLWSSGPTEMFCASCEVRTEFIYVM